MSKLIVIHYIRIVFCLSEGNRSALAHVTIAERALHMMNYLDFDL